MANCPNRNLNAWKNLVTIQGENIAYLLWDKFNGVVPKQFYTVTNPAESATSDLISNEVFDDTEVTAQPFQFRNYDSGSYYKENILKSGKKKITVRSTKYSPGVYSFEDIYLKIQSRNDNKPIYFKDLKDKESFKENFIGENNVVNPLIDSFLEGKVPMYVYDIGKVEVDRMALPSDFKGSADYIAAPKGYTLTSIPLLDHYLKTMYESRAAFSKKLTGIKSPDKRVALDRKIEKLNSDIDTLTTFRTAEALFEVGEKEMSDLTNEFEDMEEIHELLEAYRSSQAWMNIDRYYAIDLARDFEDVRSELVEQAVKIQSQAHLLNKKIHDKLVNTVINMANEYLSPEKVKELFTPIKDLGMLGAEMTGVSYSSDAMDQLVGKVIQSIKDLTNHDINEFNEELFSKLKKAGKNDINFLFPNRKLITKYNTEFYDTYSEKMEQAKKKKITWKEYYSWEKKNMTYTLSDDGKKAFEDYKDLRKVDFMELSDEGDEEFDEVGYNTEMKRWDPEEFQKYLDGKEERPNEYGSRFFSKEPNVALSPEYKNLSKGELEFYEYFMDAVAEAHELLPKDYKFGTFDKDLLAKEFFFNTPPKVFDILKGAHKDVGHFIANLATVKVGVDARDTRITSPITGASFESAKFKPLGQFTKQTDTFGRTNYLDAFRLFKIGSLTFKYKHQAEDLLNLIKDLSATERKVATIGPSGKGVKGLFNENHIAKSATRRLDRLNYTIDAYLTEVYKAPSPHTSIGSESRKLSFSKLADGINSFTRIRQMALAPMSAISNIMMGMAGNYMYAAGNENMDTKSLTKAIWMLKASPIKYWTHGKIDLGNINNLLAAVMNRWGMLGDITEDMSNGKSFADKLFTFHKGGEYLNQGSSVLAQMLFKKIKSKSGQMKPLRDFISTNEHGVISIDFKNIADDSEFKDMASFDKFFNTARRVNEKIHGDYNSMTMINKNAIGRMFMVFRKWMPMFVKERFGERYEDIDLGTQEGRWRSYYNMVIDEDGKLNTKEGAKNIGKLLFKILVPVLSRSTEFGMMDKTEQDNMKRNIREIQMIVIVKFLKFATLALLGGGEDDDKRTPKFYKYFYNQLERFNTELMFSYSLSDYKQVVRDFFPAMATADQITELIGAMKNKAIHPEKDTYQRGFRKGQSKLFVETQQTIPIVKQVDQIFSSWSQVYSDDFVR